jgi:hypothetical protein
MTDLPSPGEAIPTMRCAVCEADVPAGAFCAFCGAYLSPHRGDGRGLLRTGAYAAAPGEHLLRLSVATSLFPHLAHRSRAPFRIALAVVVLVLVALALLRWQAPLIAVCALGLSMLFMLYLRESDVVDDLPKRDLVLTVGLAVALGVGWALLTGSIVAGNYRVALNDGAAAASPVLERLGVEVGSALLMLVPAALVRLSASPRRESLDGFVFGVLSAVMFTAASTLTRLTPQFATGATTHERTVIELLAEAAIQGLALPVTAAAAGGLFGVALWFARPAGESRRPALLLLASSLAVVVVVYAALGALDMAAVANGFHVGLHVVVATTMLLALRVGVQVALLHEAHDEMHPEAQVLCPHCDHIVPDTAFCPYCGFAARAASRTARATRGATLSTDNSAVRPGYAVPAGAYTAVSLRHTSHARLLTMLGVGAAVAAVVAVTVSVFSTPAPAPYVCPPECGQPPIGKPVATNPWFKSSDGRFAVQYPVAGSAYKVKLEANEVVLDFTAGDKGTMELFGRPAAGRTPKQIADNLISGQYPDATTAYEIPNAMVGYQPGYGVVKDEYPQDASGKFTRLRLVVMVAVKDNYALVAAAMGPYHRFTPDFGSGHPSGVNMQLALDMGKYVNSFAWLDDSPQ